MPTYDYHCGKHGAFEVFRSMDERNSPAKCPICEEMCHRVLKMPALKALDQSVSNAIDRNIRSRFEPKEYNPSKGLTDQGIPPSHRPQKRKRTYAGPRSWVMESAKSSL